MFSYSEFHEDPEKIMKENWDQLLVRTRCLRFGTEAFGAFLYLVKNVNHPLYFVHIIELEVEASKNNIVVDAVFLDVIPYGPS